jgi:hypothetical protein
MGLGSRYFLGNILEFPSSLLWEEGITQTLEGLKQRVSDHFSGIWHSGEKCDNLCCASHIYLRFYNDSFGSSSVPSSHSQIRVAILPTKFLPPAAPPLSHQTEAISGVSKYNS